MFTVPSCGVRFANVDRFVSHRKKIVLHFRKRDFHLFSAGTDGRGGYYTTSFSIIFSENDTRFRGGRLFSVLFSPRPNRRRRYRKSRERVRSSIFSPLFSNRHVTGHLHGDRRVILSLYRTAAECNSLT